MFASKCIKQQQLKQNKLEKEMLACSKKANVFDCTCCFSTDRCDDMNVPHS